MLPAFTADTPRPVNRTRHEQAQTLGQRLQAVPFDRVLCSELERTHTADLLLGDRISPADCPRTQ
jgi:alpha-ribazole phosphatase